MSDKVPIFGEIYRKAINSMEEFQLQDLTEEAIEKALMEIEEYKKANPPILMDKGVPDFNQSNVYVNGRCLACWRKK